MPVEPTKERSRWTWPARVRAAAVFAFVCWHLFMMLVTNTEVDRHVDKWKEAAANSAAGRRVAQVAGVSIRTACWYEKMACLDQSWGMFSSPLARRTPFLACRIEFDDGSSQLRLSPNEPSDLTHFWRFRFQRMRKLEEHLLGEVEGTYEYGLLERFAHNEVKQWRRDNPSDSRRVAQIVLLRRSYDIPQPGDLWKKSPAVETTEHARFQPRAKQE